VKSQTTFGLVGISIVLIGLLTFLILRPVNHVDWELPSHARIRDTASIGAALSKYQFDHNGRLPSHLSELAPQYIPPVNIRYFFWPLKSKDTANVSPEELSRQIDYEGAFVYLGERGIEANMLLYQRTNVAANQGMTNVMVLTTNFTPTVLSVEEVEARLHQLK
jgi:hypothetical protein